MKNLLHSKAAKCTLIEMFKLHSFEWIFELLTCYIDSHTKQILTTLRWFYCLHFSHFCFVVVARLVFFSHFYFVVVGHIHIHILSTLSNKSSAHITEWNFDLWCIHNHKNMKLSELAEQIAFIHVNFKQIHLELKSKWMQRNNARENTSKIATNEQK